MNDVWSNVWWIIRFKMDLNNVLFKMKTNKDKWLFEVMNFDYFIIFVLEILRGKFVCWNKSKVEY